MIFKIIRVLKDTFREWQRDKVSRLAAALAYYAVFSLAPLLVLAVAIAGSFFGTDTAKVEIIEYIENLVGSETAGLIVTALNNAAQPKANNIASILSVGILLLAASGVFVQLQDALNEVWNVAPPKKGGIWYFIRKRLFSFLMVLFIGFLLMLSLAISTVIPIIYKYKKELDFIPGSELLWENLDIGNLEIIISLALMTFVFALLFKFVPDTKVYWRDVWVGGFITSLLFALGKYLLGWYLNKVSMGSAYGAAGSLIVLLTWIYYSAQIILFGGEFTQVYSKIFGMKRISRDSKRYR